MLSFLSAVRNDRNKKKKEKVIEESAVTVGPMNELSDAEQQIVTQIEEAHLKSFPLMLPGDSDTERVCLIFVA